MEKKVSILTPCYNGEDLIWRLLDSILNQTYPCIEMFVIDDGSTDDSASVIQSYIPRFEAKGYTLTYVYQENAGASDAINNGLKLIGGDYLVWPDADDWYAVDDAIQQMVVCLDNSDESVSMVRTQSYILEEDTLQKIGKCCVNKDTKGKTNLFEDCIFGLNGFWFGAGNYMVKTAKIAALIPDKEIFADKQAGQNWQILLPLLYNHKCVTIESFLYNILERKTSHSRMKHASIEPQLLIYDAYEQTLLSTIGNLTNMPTADKTKYLQVTRNRYRTARFELFIFNKRFKEARKVFSEFDAVSKRIALINLVKIAVKRLFYCIKGIKV